MDVAGIVREVGIVGRVKVGDCEARGSACTRHFYLDPAEDEDDDDDDVMRRSLFMILVKFDVLRNWGRAAHSQVEQAVKSKTMKGC